MMFSGLLEVHMLGCKVASRMDEVVGSEDPAHGDVNAGLVRQMPQTRVIFE